MEKMLVYTTFVKPMSTIMLFRLCSTSAMALKFLEHVPNSYENTNPKSNNQNGIVFM